jgi:hypothetical protein
MGVWYEGMSSSRFPCTCWNAPTNIGCKPACYSWPLKQLHHNDEATARKLVAWALNGARDESGGVFIDSGWFQLDKTRVPTPDDLAVVQQAVGDSGALDPPSFWEKMPDQSIVQKYQLYPGNKEWEEVEKTFLSSMVASKVKIHSIGESERKAGSVYFLTNSISHRVQNEY